MPVNINIIIALNHLGIEPFKTYQCVAIKSL